MSKPHVYDKAKWHYGGDFPRGLSDYQGFVHTGMFVGWLIEHGMISEEFEPETARFHSGELTGTQVYELWDGALVDDMLTEKGNEFAHAYFDFKLGKYLADYGELLGRGLPSHYHVQDNGENYARLKERIDERYADWQRTRRT